MISVRNLSLAMVIHGRKDNVLLLGTNVLSLGTLWGFRIEIAMKDQL